jgi:hypothetical protein
LRALWLPTDSQSTSNSIAVWTENGNSLPVFKENGTPNPKLVLVGGEPVSSKGGTFYLEYRINVKRVQRPCGTTPRKAIDPRG